MSKVLKYKIQLSCTSSKIDRDGDNVVKLQFKDGCSGDNITADSVIDITLTPTNSGFKEFKKGNCYQVKFIEL